MIPWPVNRLDLAVKARLFRALSDGIDIELAETLYKRHITQRNGGMEASTGAGGKTQVQDFIIAASHLYISLRTKGYRQDCPIGISHNGDLIRGAHRLAASTVLGIKPDVSYSSKKGASWDFGWFQERFHHDDILRILNDWVRHDASSTAFVLWGPARDEWDKLTASISTLAPVVGFVDLEIPKGLEAMVYDVYGLSPDLTKMIKNVSRKVARLADSHQSIRVVVAQDRNGYQGMIKESVRKASSLPVDQYITCHGASSRRESVYLADIVLNPVYLWHLKLRRPLREAFVARMVEARQSLGSLEACIVGGSVMEILGFRQSDDLDLTVTAHGRKILGRRSRPLSENVDLVSETYHRGAPVCYTDDQLIHSREGSFPVLGMRAASLDVMKDRKTWHGRKTDIADLKLIKAL